MREQSIFWFGIMIVCGSGFCALPAQAKYGGGRGTATEPYLIGTAEHMNILGGESRDWGKHFKLIADIDFGGSTGAQFNFIGYFSGVFDGNGHSIHNFEPLDSCASFRVGLFGTISNQGEVRNLTLVNPRVQCLNSSSSFSGGLLVGELNGKVTNCHVIGGYIEKYFPPWPRNRIYGDIGGLVGNMDMDAVVSDCSVKDTNIGGDAAGGISGGNGLGTIQDCTVINIDINGGWNTGGIISRNAGKVERCSATGVIRAEGVAGGIVGVTGCPPNAPFDPVIRECYASCIVLSDDQAGGLAGKAADKCLIIDCYAAGSVEGYSNGGLVCCYGNFSGVAPQVVNCYAAAFVSENNKGGLIKHAHLDGGPVIVLNSFWDVEASGVMNSAGGTGITTAQMKTKDTFTTAGWDFTTPIWKMCDRPDYPRLWWEECPPPLIIYVDADATGANNGSSWDHAYNDLQDALVFAESSDEIRVAQGAYSPEGPLPDIRRPSNPNPADGETGVSRTADLSWTAGSDATSHDVYFGTTSPGIFQGNQTATTFDPGTMAYATTYYWRIDEVGAYGTITGTVWSFRTTGPGPSSPTSLPPPVDRTATFHLKNGVVIKGGYAGCGEPNADARDIKVYETILSGDLNGNDVPVADPCDLLTEPTRAENSYHVVTGSGCDETAVLEGFTITGGNAYYASHYQGGGMFNNYSSPTVANCTFSGNLSVDGGGMGNINSSPIVTNCTFIGNWAEIGGGMCNNGGSPTLTNCVFIGNFSFSGGGISNYGSSPMISNCKFIGNQAWQSNGGGMRNSYSAPILMNCLFIWNTAGLTNGGGMANLLSGPLLTNCTFIGNSAGGRGGGMYSTMSEPILTNCILWGNTPQEIYGGTPVVTYSDVQGGWPGIGNINADPCFVDSAIGDYHLLQTSACINVADNNSLPADTQDLDGDSNTTEPIPFDIEGNPRIVYDVVDMGPYEFYNTAPIADAGPDQIVECACNTGEGTKVTLDGTNSSDPDRGVLTYTWTGSFVESPAHGASPTVTLDGGCPGEYVITLVVSDGIDDSEPNDVVITVVDTTPPEFEFSVAPTMLWPPDHKMYEITPSWTVSDECDATPEVSLVSIVANEGDDTIGDGHTSNDIQIGEDGSIYLRSERSGTSDDRVYTITYQAIDDCGNATVRSAAVSIPHDFRVLARIAFRWLWAGPGRIPEDLNGDGVVNLKDIAIFANNWIQ